LLGRGGLGPEILAGGLSTEFPCDGLGGVEGCVFLGGITNNHSLFISSWDEVSLYELVADQ
jgi:hypothetical protein